MMTTSPSTVLTSTPLLPTTSLLPHIQSKPSQQPSLQPHLSSEQQKKDQKPISGNNDVTATAEEILKRELMNQKVRADNRERKKRWRQQNEERSKFITVNVQQIERTNCLVKRIASKNGNGLKKNFSNVNKNEKKRNAEKT
ncbi:hypothetical protein BDF20DRAFT_3379 [Mycotypha africana]|uniref:uncharacterized protein n=1 Tax=Mycotypha africana TaxID=64632 RepID=UPI0023005DDF|nr:uncharacterized protein BDF20DRAFT_3379 [Mycotypha africana]KAI8990806.1 hypothetical protein BDF20DRAFT_3379 [Mycotypha africana]